MSQMILNSYLNNRDDIFINIHDEAHTSNYTQVMSFETTSSIQLILSVVNQ